MKRRPLAILALVLACGTTGISGVFAAKIASNNSALKPIPVPAPVVPSSRQPASLGQVTLVSLEEVYVNVGSADVENHSLAVKMELELFDHESRDVIDQFQSSLRHAVIQTALEQPYSDLKTLAGKLYFKEVLVARMNDILRQPTIRDVHFSSFYLR